jgi:hypothetical protein
MPGGRSPLVTRPGRLLEPHRHRSRASGYASGVAGELTTFISGGPSGVTVAGASTCFRWFVHPRIGDAAAAPFVVASAGTADFPRTSSTRGRHPCSTTPHRSIAATPVARPWSATAPASGAAATPNRSWPATRPSPTTSRSPDGAPAAVRVSRARPFRRRRPADDRRGSGRAGAAAGAGAVGAGRQTV